MKPISISRFWKAFYRRTSIQMVLSLAFTAVAIIGMLFLGASLFWQFSRASEEQTEQSSRLVLAQVNRHMDNYLRNMMRVSDAAYYHIIKDTDMAESDMTEQLSLLYESNRDVIVSIAVFSGDGSLHAAVPLPELKSGVEPAKEGWFIRAVDRIENLHFSTPHVQNLFRDPDYRYSWVVSLSRQVELTEAGRVQDGVLLVDMSFGGIEQLCKDVSLGGGQGYLYLVDARGEIIYHPRQQLIYAGLLEENNITAASYADGSHTEVFGGERRQITVKTVGYTGWKLIGVVPQASSLDGYAHMLWFFLFIVLFSVFLLVFVNMHLSERITAPLKKLDRAVQAMEAGDQEVALELNGPQEVENLSRSINSMVATLRRLMDDKVRQEEQKRRSELDVLQSQINPHFLYNTLDSVVWMTENGRTGEAVTMLTALARFFRLSLSRGSSVISVGDELEHARHYLTIQKMRYKNKFSADISAGEGVEQCYTLKLIVQPVLENAIYHGMAYADGDGEIHVRAGRDGDDVVIDVTDNGPGMPAELLEGLLESESTAPIKGAKGSGIGFSNVHRRIVLAYGPQYGLTIGSEPDKGTWVRIRLPALDESEAREYHKEESR